MIIVGHVITADHGLRLPFRDLVFLREIDLFAAGAAAWV